MIFSATPSIISFETFDKDKISNVSYIKELLEKRVLSPNAKFLSGMPVLAFAIQHEAFETVKCLLEHGARLNATDEQDISCIDHLRSTSSEFFAACFDLALEKEYWTIITAYLSKGMSNEDFERVLSQAKPIDENALTLVEKSKMVLLYIAIKKQLPKAVKFLLEHNVSANAFFEKGGSLLCLAISWLEYNSNATWIQKESANYQANNPIMYEIIELLLQHNAIPRGEVRSSVNHVYSPLTYSVFRRDVKLLELLLAHNPYLKVFSSTEAAKTFLCEADAVDATPLSIAYVNKSRKMYQFLLGKCPDLTINDVGAFSSFLFSAGDYAIFMKEILSPLPLEHRKLLFQAYSTKRGEAGDGVVNMAMRRNTISMTSTLLKQGADLPIVTSKNGNKRINSVAKKKLLLSNWKEYFADYLKDLKAAEATPSLRDLSANVIYDHTHQNKSATKQLKGYLPLELFELYQSTPQRRAKQENHFKPVIRECLENALSVNKDVDENETKRAKTSL